MTASRMPLAWRLPPQTFGLSFAEMARDGVHGNEGVALWLGRREEAVVAVTHVLALRGPGVIRRPDYLSISAELMNDVTDVAIDQEAYLIGQIHSHPLGYGVDLSQADKRYGISVPGYLSVVAPDFAQRPDTPVAACGFHIFERGDWRRFTAHEVQTRVVVAGELESPLITLGSGA
jgi:hypothetical protein